MEKGGHSEQPKPASLEDMREDEALEGNDVMHVEPSDQESSEADAETDKSNE